MRNACGNIVDSLRTHERTNWAVLSTHEILRISRTMASRAQLRLVHRLSHKIHRTFPHAYSALLPLGEHYFYPVSTAPIITPIKGKLKKGN